MNKILLIIISVICIIALIAGLTGCASIEDKSNISENHPSTMSKTNGTSVSNSSAHPKAVMPTKSSGSPSGDNTNAIDYNQFIKKVWVVKSWTTNEAYDHYFSFCIYKIVDGKLEGKFSISAIAEPDDEFYTSSYLGSINGIVKNGIAECQFSDKDGNNGNVTLVLRKSDEIQATIKYISKSKHNKEKSLDGTFLFRPYNLKDLEGFSPFTNQSFTVDLNSWGTVKFVSGKILGGNHIPTVAFLTNKDGDIYYYFNYIPNNVEFYAVSFQDVNKDGLKDIIIIYGVEENSPYNLVKVFSQNSNGLFNIDNLTEEINDSVKNKDVKSIMDYLSKKFGAQKDPIELKESNEHNTGLNYVNDKYKFGLSFPESWKGRYYVTENEYGIYFKYNTDIGRIRDIEFFGIGVAQKSEWIENSGAPTKKILEKNGLVYYVNYPTQAAFDTHVENERKEAEEFGKMYEDIESILNSFRLIE